MIDATVLFIVAVGTQAPALIVAAYRRFVAWRHAGHRTDYKRNRSTNQGECR